jgi:methionyl-tRNA formyltransferase
VKILFLGPQCAELTTYLVSLGDDVVVIEDRISVDSECLEDVDFIVSYRYRYLLKQDVLDRVRNRAINLHIALLPWNRGADPNLWSFLEETPRGVTIHYIDSGLDTGDIISQEAVEFLPDDTLRTSYQRLSMSIEALFMKVWPNIRAGKVNPISQVGEGSFHRLKDRTAYEHLLVNEWDTPVSALLGRARKSN